MKDESLLPRLRAATEADVEAVLAAMTDNGDIELVPTATLLAFYNRMLDRLRS